MSRRTIVHPSSLSSSWRRPRLARPLGIAALSLALLAPGAAQAVYQCDGETDDCTCGGDNPYPCCDNGNGNFGNCTWWGWESACCNWTYPLPGWGNANQWAGNASAHPDFDVVSSPVVGSIACRVSGYYGHVAWVTAVNGSNITVTEMNCCTDCNNGVRTHSYAASWFDGGFIVRANGCECTSGQQQNGDCGNCGTRSRTCGSDCHWGSWSACTGEGVCAEGQTQSQDCGDCGQQTRTCSSSCAWGSWGACDGPDPGGSCDTGQLGVCAAGTQACVGGNIECQATTSASAEACDGLDNDCDGSTDEDGICGAGGSGTGAGGNGSGGRPANGGDGPFGGGAPVAGGPPSSGGAGGGLAADDLPPSWGSGCSCRAAGLPSEARGSWLAALALGAVSARRRRRRG